LVIFFAPQCVSELVSTGGLLAVVCLTHDEAGVLLLPDAGINNHRVVVVIVVVIVSRR
jgi:hypothetical protein